MHGECPNHGADYWRVLVLSGTAPVFLATQNQWTSHGQTVPRRVLVQGPVQHQNVGLHKANKKMSQPKQRSNQQQLEFNYIQRMKD